MLPFIKIANIQSLIYKKNNVQYICIKKTYCPLAGAIYPRKGAIRPGTAFDPYNNLLCHYTAWIAMSNIFLLISANRYIKDI